MFKDIIAEKAWRLKWRQENRERIRKLNTEAQRRRRATSAARIRETIAAWRKRNPGKVAWQNFKTRIRETAGGHLSLRQQRRYAHVYAVSVVHPVPNPELCECCGGPPNTHGKLVFDHDHETNRFRGWICDRCNKMLGHAADSADTLSKAIAYLERSRGSH